MFKLEGGESQPTSEICSPPFGGQVSVLFVFMEGLKAGGEGEDRG